MRNIVSVSGFENAVDQLVNSKYRIRLTSSDMNCVQPRKCVLSPMIWCVCVCVLYLSFDLFTYVYSYSTNFSDDVYIFTDCRRLVCTVRYLRFYDLIDFCCCFFSIYEAALY